jgi:hypothetical protein
LFPWHISHSPWEAGACSLWWEVCTILWGGDAKEEFNTAWGLASNVSSRGWCKERLVPRGWWWYPRNSVPVYPGGSDPSREGQRVLQILTSGETLERLGPSDCGDVLSQVWGNCVVGLPGMLGKDVSCWGMLGCKVGVTCRQKCLPWDIQTGSNWVCWA